MKKLLFFFIIFVFGSLVVFAQDYLMPISGSATYTTCSGNFYDDGGPSNSYSPNQNGKITFHPLSSSSKLSVTFSSFYSYGDTLFVYNGDDTNAPLIGKLEGDAGGYGTITSSATDGSLTFKFISDGNQYPVNESGWAATIACNITPTDITMIASGTFVTCSGNFYDDGGPNGSYMPNQNVLQHLNRPVHRVN